MRHTSYVLPIMHEASDAYSQTITRYPKDYKSQLFIPGYPHIYFPPEVDTGALRGLVYALKIEILQWLKRFHKNRNFFFNLINS